MQNHYTKQAEQVREYATEMARQLNHPYVGTEHLLLGLSHEYEGVAGQILSGYEVEEEKVLKVMNELITPEEGTRKRRKLAESPRLTYLMKMRKKRRISSVCMKSEPRNYFWQCFMIRIVSEPRSF